MAWILVDSIQYDENVAGETLDVVMPAFVGGDLALLSVYYDGYSIDRQVETITLLGDGWDVLSDNIETGGRDRHTAIFYKVLDSNDIGPTLKYSSTILVSNKSYTVHVFRNTLKQLNQLTVIADWAQDAAQNIQNPIPPSVTTTEANSLAVTFQMQTLDDCTAVGAPAGFTLGETIWGSTKDNRQQLVAYDLNTGTIGTKTYTAWTSTWNEVTSEYTTYTVTFSTDEVNTLANPVNISTRSDGVRYLSNFSTVSEDQFAGVCYSGQAVGFDGVAQDIDVVIPATGITLVYFDYTLVKHIATTVTPSTTHNFIPPNTISNITVWSVAISDEELAYMDDRPEYIGLSYDASELMFALPSESALSVEECLAWYPMCEYLGSTVYNHLPGGGNDITLSDYSSTRRTLNDNLNIGMQNIAYYKDEDGLIIRYDLRDSIIMNKTSHYVDTGYVCPRNGSFMVEEGLDFDHYVYVYSDRTINTYKNGVLLTEDITFNPGAQTVKLKSINYTTEFSSIKTRQMFRIYRDIPTQNEVSKVQELYDTFIAHYFGVLTDGNSTAQIIGDSAQNILEY